jgi:hypothetical protein
MRIWLAQRRENNGSPPPQRVTVLLSLTRAIDALLRRAAHLRRAFYAGLKRGTYDSKPALREYASAWSHKAL